MEKTLPMWQSLPILTNIMPTQLRVTVEGWHLMLTAPHGDYVFLYRHPKQQSSAWIAEKQGLAARPQSFTLIMGIF